MRAAGLALEAIVGERVDQKAKEYLRTLRLRIRTEGPFFRRTTTCLWAVVAAVILVGLPVLWQGFGISPYLIGGYLGAILVAAFQAGGHTDRSKSGLCWLLIVGFLVCSTMFAGVFVGNVAWARRFAVLFCSFIAIGSIAVWWKGPRGWLVLTAAGLAVAAVVIGGFVPPLWSGTTRTIRSTGAPTQPTWTPDGKSIYWLSTGQRGADEAVFHIAGIDDDPVTLLLPGDDNDWSIFPQRPTGEIVLLRSYTEPDDEWRSELYIVDPVKGLKKLEYVPRESVLFTLARFGAPLWSPDGRWALVWLPADGDSFKSGFRGAAVDMQTGRMVKLDDMAFGRCIRWVSDREFRATVGSRKEEGNRSNRRVVENRIGVHTVNVESGEIRSKKMFDIPFDSHAVSLPGAEYAVLSADHQPHETGMRTFPTAIIDLSTGERLDLPDRQSEQNMAGFGWHAERKLLAYHSPRNESTEQGRLLLVNAERGVVTERPIPATHALRGFQISPDGNKVLFFRTRRDREVFLNYARTEIWDIRTGRIEPLCAMGFGCFFAMLVRGPWSWTPWSPDGRYVMYPAWHVTTAGFCYALEVADYGGWLAGRK
jgi:dipeptidyl aminopeptidase/acylaminoacyl peptidase